MRPVVIALTALAATGSAAAQEIVGRREATFNLAETVGSGAWVRIASPNGTIRITQGSGSQVAIQAEKDVKKGDIEDAGFVVRKGRDGLTICAVFQDADECGDDGNYSGEGLPRNWWRNHQIRINFTVQVPEGVRVKASSGNGDISIAGAGAEVIAATGNGRVDVTETTGRVEANSGNGRVTIEGARGPVDVTTGNGDVRATTSQGPVTATSGNGDIEVSMDRLSGSPDMEFSTGNGRITVTVPEGYGAELDSHTGNGRVEVDFPLKLRGRINPSRVRGTLGEGGGRLVLSSGNGNLEVRRR